ncbi:TetR family transcriptional regulator C-terminal domain-containing protein [Nonomuraea sp. NPDC046802]|uniref:TetR/AcrR family transcriptional regulator n=1 Tax=Nonomuraea sp. NPDC046802 TaxID=3154919 RepID=UPI0033CC833A
MRNEKREQGRREHAPRDRAAREARICAAALEVVAAHGLRGLTHRAVDECAGLPAGSTSYYFRTRIALLMALVDHVAAADLGEPPPTPARLSPDALSRLIAERLYELLTDGRTRLLARYELSLEAVRRPELRERLEASGAIFRNLLAELLRSAGSPDPERHARQLVAWCDGMLYDTLAGAGTRHPATRADLAAGVRDLLRAVLPQAGAGN